MCLSWAYQPDYRQLPTKYYNLPHNANRAGQTARCRSRGAYQLNFVSHLSTTHRQISQFLPPSCLTKPHGSAVNHREHRRASRASRASRPVLTSILLGRQARQRRHSAVHERDIRSGRGVRASSGVYIQRWLSGERARARARGEV